MTKLEKYGNKVAEAAALEGRPEGVGSGSDSQLLPFIFKKEDTMKNARINFGIPSTFTAILYKGIGIGVVTDYYFSELSGNCEFDGDGNLIISGDCSLAIAE